MGSTEAAGGAMGSGNWGHGKYRGWTRRENQFVRNNYDKMLYADLGRRIQRSERAVAVHAHKLGLRTTPEIVSSKITSVTDEAFFDKWSPESAYVFGFLAADGNLWKEKSHKQGSRVQMALHQKDKEILDKFVERIGRRIHKDRDMIRWIFRSKRIYNKLVDLGLHERKTHSLTWPKIPKRVLPDFLRGYSDGDGCFCILTRGHRPCWSVNGTKKFLESLSLQISPIVNHKYPCYKSRRQTYVIILHGKNAIKIGKFMYGKCKPYFCLTRKWEVWNGF